MGKDRAHTWPVPFLQAFRQGQFSNGKALGVKGMLTSKFFGSSNFTINLTTGSNVKDNKDRDDIAIQIGCREKEGWVLNSLFERKWGDEERHPLNVEEDEEFYLRIEPMNDHFAIYVNGEKMCTYKYRIDLRYINHVYIEGQIKLHRVAFEGQYYMVPFEYELGKFGFGSTLYVTGKPDSNAKNFDIDLAGADDDNVILTISVRMKDQVVVRNTQKNGKWEDEEREGPEFPFVGDEEFDLAVDCGPNFYHIIINGQSYCKYQHRQSPTGIKKLAISGDMELKSVYV